MDFIDYREKLGIGFDDKELEKLFFVRIFNVLDCLNDMPSQISGEEYIDFCNMTACKMNYNAYSNNYFYEIVGILHDKTSSIKEFLSYYIFFIKCQKDSDYKKWNRANFYNLLCNSLSDSHIQFDVVEDNGDFFIFPKGAKELDNALVSQPLEWLNKYPESRKEFIASLKQYSDATEDNASDVADKFRKALERFFQEFFESQKSLENYKSDFGKYLKDRDIPKELANTFENTLDLYCKYINNYAKHGNGVNINALEFIMYQTGNIIRLLCTI